MESLKPDYPAFHPLTPVPGTLMWREAREKGWLEITDFARHDWMTPVMGTDTLSREELELVIWEMNKRYLNPLRIARGIFSRHAYRRRMYVWWLLVTLRALADYLVDRIFPSRSVAGRVALSDYVGMVRPAWYEE